MTNWPNWEGRPERTCGEHRTLGYRAWCFDCGEYCSPLGPCIRCEEPELRARADDSLLVPYGMIWRPKPGTMKWHWRMSRTGRGFPTGSQVVPVFVRRDDVDADPPG